jgi:hypothetical protein
MPHTLVIMFKCPIDNNAIEFELPVIGNQMTLAELDAIPFSLYCLQCKWQGQIQGIQRIGVQRVDWN